MDATQRKQIRNENKEMQINDFITVPLTKINIWFTCWFMFVVLTIIPGSILWLITLGGFRYFHLSSLLCTFLVEKDINASK